MGSKRSRNDFFSGFHDESLRPLSENLNSSDQQTAQLLQVDSLLWLFLTYSKNFLKNFITLTFLASTN